MKVISSMDKETLAINGWWQTLDNSFRVPAQGEPDARIVFCGFDRKAYKLPLSDGSVKDAECPPMLMIAVHKLGTEDGLMINVPFESLKELAAWSKERSGII